MEKVILTEEGYKQLEKRLEELKFVKRPEITERIKIARDFGDLSENEQARIEGEIVEIEAKLKVAEIIKNDGGHGVVNVGNKVKILDVDMNEEVTYEIVGTTEADINALRISNESPLGNALVGAKVGETVTVKAPKCTYQVKILAIVE